MLEQPTRRNFMLGLGAMAAGATAAKALRYGKRDSSPSAGVMPMNDLHPHGRFFGTAVRPDQLVEGSRSATLIKQHCDFVVPEFHGQWSAVEWRPGDPWFGNLDAIASFAREHGMGLRGHSLIWEQMTPDWAREAMVESQNWSIVHDHFATMLPKYNDITADWIVVNECIDTENGYHSIRRNSFQQAFGNDYIARAFETAREIAPNARLFINDYALEYNNPVDEARRSGLLRLVEKLRASGTPLDGVGVQAHLELAKGPLAKKALHSFYAELADMGVEIAITELDVLEHDRAAPLALRDARVAATTKEFLDVVREHPAIRTVATWGLSDKGSWLQERADETMEANVCSPIDCDALNRGLPYDGDYQGKPMLAALGSKRTRLLQV